MLFNDKLNLEINEEASESHESWKKNTFTILKYAISELKLSEDQAEMGTHHVMLKKSFAD